MAFFHSTNTIDKKVNPDLDEIVKRRELWLLLIHDRGMNLKSPHKKKITTCKHIKK